MTNCRRTLLRLLAGAALASLAHTAGAQASPYYLGVSQTFTRDSNLLRLADGQVAPAGFSKSDTISSTALVAGLDQRISRQRVYGDLTLRSNRLSNNDLFNNNGYALSAGLDWETAERFSGSLKAVSNRNLARFNTEEIGLVTKKNLETTQQLDALLRVGMVTALTFEANVGVRSVDYTAVEYRSREFRQDSASLGVRYRPSGASSVGLALRQTNGRYPNFRPLPDGSFEADRYTRRNLDLTGTLAPTGASSFNARLSVGKTDYDVATQRSFSGVTGVLGWNWQPSAKLRLNTRLSRDPGQDSYFFDNRVSDATVEYSRVTTSLGLRADYELSAKVFLNAGATVSRRSLARTLPQIPGVVSELTGSDRSTALSLGAVWLPTRSIRVGCDLGRDQRSGGAPLSSDLSASSIGCYGQLTLQ